MYCFSEVNIKAINKSETSTIDIDRKPGRVSSKNVNGKFQCTYEGFDKEYDSTAAKYTHEKIKHGRQKKEDVNESNRKETIMRNEAMVCLYWNDLFEGVCMAMLSCIG